MDKERLLRYLNQKYMSKCEIACSLPLGMNADEVWNTILEERFSRRTDLPLRNIHGNCYWYVLTDKMIAASEKIVEELIESWSDAKSQIGAYSSLENAKKACKAGYSVFDSNGKSVYPLKKSVDEIAREVIQGKWGNGEERKKKLIAAGYDYAEVQKKVNKLI